MGKGAVVSGTQDHITIGALVCIQETPKQSAVSKNHHLLHDLMTIQQGYLSTSQNWLLTLATEIKTASKLSENMSDVEHPNMYSHSGKERNCSFFQ